MLKNKPWLKCTLKIATSMVTESTSAAGRVSRPSKMANPPKNSPLPARNAIATPGSKPIEAIH
ncbi:Uncharacterised protein [Vibrio cholerae]|nr:Uncharacterised protein [Vibrio cholerae]CSB23761.1 Uncharacterised protein [Vibrio cholerae]CSB35784.1 Uncharacterised protein [Vibrio cholerae]CSC47345.1 Uncharacterised protein [Vibrio cholerae]CSC88752.1 Uncharacterised protein [Vibrio cholerae]